MGLPGQPCDGLAFHPMGINTLSSLMVLMLGVTSGPLDLKIPSPQQFKNSMFRCLDMYIREHFPDRAFSKPKQLHYHYDFRHSMKKKSLSKPTHFLFDYL